MSDSFVLVAAVLVAFAFGLALAAAFWWFSVRRNMRRWPVVRQLR